MVTLSFLARPEGFEPPAFGIGIHCDIQLRHGRMYSLIEEQVILYTTLPCFARGNLQFQKTFLTPVTLHFPFVCGIL